MTQDDYQNLIIELDNFGKKCKNLIPEKYDGIKNEIYRSVRHISHDLRDAFELEILALTEQKSYEKMMNPPNIKEEVFDGKSKLITN